MLLLPKLRWQPICLSLEFSPCQDLSAEIWRKIYRIIGIFVSFLYFFCACTFICICDITRKWCTAPPHFDQRNVANKSSSSKLSPSWELIYIFLVYVCVLICICIVFVSIFLFAFDQRNVANKSSPSEHSPWSKLIYIYIGLCLHFICLNLFLYLCVFIIRSIFDQRNVATKSVPSPLWNFIPFNWLLLNQRVKINAINSRILQVMSGS